MPLFLIHAKEAGYVAQAPDRKMNTACHLFWGQLNLFRSLFLSVLALSTFMVSPKLTHLPASGIFPHSTKMTTLLLSKCV